MNKTLLFLFYFSVAQSPLGLSYAEELSAQKRVFGGTEVGLDDSGLVFENGWSAVVFLLDGYQNQFCAASLIASKWLLTAAHCLYTTNGQVKNDFEITAILNQRDSGKLIFDDVILSRMIVNKIIHPEYDYYRNENDIALLELDQPVVSIAPIKLPGKYFDAPVVEVGTLSTVLGWGASEQNSQNNLLKKAQIPVANFAACVNNYAEQGVDISWNMLCAGFENGGSDACAGDSGGPLLVPSVSGDGWDQVGIVSFGIGCALPKFFGIYTRVSRYHDFIKDVICESRPPAPTLNLVDNQTSVQINLNTIDNSQNFRIYYAPFPEQTPIHYLEMHDTRSMTVAIPEDSQWYAAAQALDGNCSSGFSEIESVQ